MLAHGIEAIRAHLASLPDSSGLAVDTLREAYDKAEYVFQMPEGVTGESVTAGSVSAEILSPASIEGGRTVLYLHGGGYALGSPRSHRHMAANIAVAASAKAVLVDYRLAPESPYPAAVDDAVSVYRWLLDNGTRASDIVVAGDSAGGGLAVATLVAVREQALELPAGGVCISPWADLTNSSETYRTLAERDPMVTAESIGRWTEAYLGDRDPKTPLASPAHADLAGLPPLLIQVGADEILLGDSRLLASNAQAAGVPVELEEWKDMIHVWHWFGEYLDEAAEATAGIARFVAARTG